MCNIDHINNINMFEFLTFIKVRVAYGKYASRYKLIYYEYETYIVILATFYQ